MLWGYYIQPSAWFLKQPRKDNISEHKPIPAKLFDIKQMSDSVFNTTLKSGLSVTIHCDGLFLFDFSNVSEIQTENSEASFETKATIRLERAQIINTYAVCLLKAIYDKQKHILPTTFITPHDTAFRR